MWGCCHSVKRAVTRDIAAGIVTLHTANDMYEHCHKTLNVYDKGRCQHKVQQFFLVEKSKITRKLATGMLGLVPGSRKLHHLRLLAENVLATRQLSCFCQFCIAGQNDQCTSSAHIGEWQIVKVKYKGPASLLPSFTFGTWTDNWADASVPCSDDVQQQQMESNCSGNSCEMQVSGSSHSGSRPSPTNLEDDGSEPDPTNL